MAGLIFIVVCVSAGLIVWGVAVILDVSAKRKAEKDRREHPDYFHQRDEVVKPLCDKMWEANVKMRNIRERIDYLMENIRYYPEATQKEMEAELTALREQYPQAESDFQAIREEYMKESALLDELGTKCFKNYVTRG